MQQASRQLRTKRKPGIASELTRLGIALVLSGWLSSNLKADDVRTLVSEHCAACHDESTRKGGLDLTSLALKLNDESVRNRWIQIYDRVQNREMPPDPKDLAESQRALLLKSLLKVLAAADRKDVLANGRGPMRRLTRGEFEQNLRDLLKLPLLDIRDGLPEDRLKHGFNRTADALDMSRVQLKAYLDAADIALRQAMVTEAKPPPVTKFRAAGRQLFSATGTFGGRQAMFFVKKNQAVSNEDLKASPDDPALELALFRSAHWPYYGYPRGFVAKLPGEYRVRFSARSVLQTNGFQLKPGKRPVPMTFRARKPSGPDVSGDVRATGGLMDVLPEVKTFETTIRLLPTETFEYSLLGLPVPLARNVDGGPPTYRYPPFPEGGQPGVAVQWLELEGPIPPETWPPASHRVLFDDLGIAPAPADPTKAARRLLRRFVRLAAREPVDKQTLATFENLILAHLKKNVPFQEAILTGYRAFLCSGSFLYLRDPSDPASRDVEQFAIASRLSHFLTNSRPDAALMKLAEQGKLRDSATIRSETDRLIQTSGFERFVGNFTDYWLNLRHILREEPDIRLFPEYRFDNYLIESMERETRRFFVAMIRDNLPAGVLVDADFAYINDRLAQHYGLPPLNGSGLRKVSLSKESPYGGLLTQAAVLKVTSSGTSTSPVIRGAWIMERLLGEPPPPPPTSVPAVEPDIRGAKTIRQLLAAHTRDESCAACHARFDPVGLALENFDILGKWRTRYRSIGETEADGKKTAGDRSQISSRQLVTGIDRAGHDFRYVLAEPVDSAGTLRDGRSFSGIRQLKKILAANPRQLARNLLFQFTVYSTGTPVRFSDREQIEAILDNCAGSGFRVRDLLHGLIQSEVFLGKGHQR